ncbi:MAG: class I SAM-dependent methyltransferase, partial [Candidatus Hodarchaeota archaeon]
MTDIDATIQSTMVGALLARAVFSKAYPELLDDQKASELIERIKERNPDSEPEFAKAEQFIDEFIGLSLLIRAKIFDNVIREFISKNPSATVVNLGCGLDTTFSRVDNNKIKWYNLDLPDAIEYRRSLLPDSSRNICIPRSAFDYKWFEEVDFNQEKGIFFFAGGVFDYFEQKKIIELCKAMAERYPKGELIFDATSKSGARIINRRFRRVGAEGLNFRLALKNPVKNIPKWSNRIELVDCLLGFG